MLVVVGGHSRNVGKTSVVAGIIRAIPEARWTAVKITQYGHGVCTRVGEGCDCAGDRHPFSLSEETAPNDRDSGRFLAAGAVHSYWLRTQMGQLGNALPALREILAASQNAIFESNSVLQFFRPDRYLIVLDPAVADMKDSTRRYFDRADAFVVVDRGVVKAPWAGIPSRWLEGKPQFRVTPPDYVSGEVVKFVR